MFVLGLISVILYLRKSFSKDQITIRDNFFMYRQKFKDTKSLKGLKFGCQ
jgi:hypothetical protein